MPGVVKDAGRGQTTLPSSNPRRQRLVETAKLLRAAQTDEEAADALEAALELAKE